jgi:8-oxo-dGTP diphosphatase
VTLLSGFRIKRKIGPQLGASALIQRFDGKVILVKRSKEPGKGYWALPAWLTKYGEKVEETAIRETKEETGLEIKLQGLVGVYDILKKDKKGRTRYHYVSVCFKGKEIGGKLKTGTDVEEVRWFDLRELKEEMLTESTRKALRDAKVL